MYLYRAGPQPLGMFVQVLPSKVILDGEMVVWNKTRGVFEAFGGLRSTMIAAKEGVPEDQVKGGG